MTLTLPPPPPYTPAAANARDVSGRVIKGNAGRPRGSRNKRTILIEQLFAGELENIAAIAIALAKNGDVAMIREILTRVAPARRGTPIQITGFPKIESVKDVPPALAHIAGRVAAGELSPEEAAALAAVLREFVTASEAVDMEARLAALEDRIAKTA